MWVFEGGFELSVSVYTVRGSYFAIKQFFIRNETRPYVALPEVSALEPLTGKTRIGVMEGRSSFQIEIE